MVQMIENKLQTKNEIFILCRQISLSTKVGAQTRNSIEKYLHRISAEIFEFVQSFQNNDESHLHHY